MRSFLVPLLIVTLSACSGTVAQEEDTTATTTPGSAPELTTPEPTPVPTYTAAPSMEPSAVVSADPMPGWQWFHHAEYDIAHPQTWHVEENAYGSSETRIISSETNSLVLIRIHKLDDQTGAQWIDWVRENADRVLLHWLAPDMIQPNATVLGQPAFFHFQPAAGGTGDTATLLFPDGERLFRVYFHTGTLPPLDAEASVFQTMLTTLRPASGLAGETALPTGWERGDSLVISSTRVETGFLPVVEVAGTMLDWPAIGSGTFPLEAEDGQIYSIYSPLVYSFAGLPRDIQLVSTQNLQPGHRVRVQGLTLPSGEILSQVVFFEQDEQWVLHHYRRFFDLNDAPLRPDLLALYPDDATVTAWLYGPLRDVLPYVIDGDGSPIPASDITNQLDQPALAMGTLQPSEAQVVLEELYLQEGVCTPISRTIPESEETYTITYCDQWVRIIPAVGPVEIAGTVLSAIPDQGVIVLEEPVQGFVTITVGEGAPPVD